MVTTLRLLLGHEGEFTIAADKARGYDS